MDVCTPIFTRNWALVYVNTIFVTFQPNEPNYFLFLSLSGPRVNLAKMTTSSSQNHNNLELVMTEDPDFIRT